MNRRERKAFDDPKLGALTRDPIRRGELSFLQPARGYRFTHDALLLADFAANAITARTPVEICDVGAGCGVVGLLLLRRVAQARLIAVELQPRLAELVRRNLAENALAERAEVMELDLAVASEARRLRGGRFDWVVSNPPYQAAGRGGANRDEEAAVARHEVRLPLSRLVAELRRLLKPLGHAALVYPSARAGELLHLAAQAGLSPRVLRFVHPKADEPATRVLVLLQKGGAPGRLEVQWPLIERHKDGRSTEELLRIVEY